jgi:hypothetical protein
VAQLGDVKRRLLSLVDRTCPEFATGLADGCGQAARMVWETWTWPAALAAVPTTRLAVGLARLSHGHCGAATARQVRAAALAFERRVRWRPIRELERLVAEVEQEISRW